MRRRGLPYLAVAALSAIVLPAVAHADSRADATLDAAEVTVGRPAALTVDVAGEAVGEPVVPHVDGLQVVPIGTSQRVTIVDGTPDIATSYRFAVVASHPGSYTIPPIAVGGMQTAPVAFVAHVGSAAGTNATNAAPADAHAPSADAAAPGHAFLRLVVPKRRLVVGESIPVTVKAYFSPGTSATVEARPTLSSDAFAVSGLDGHATQTQETVRGVPYGVLTWRGKFTALAPTQQALSAEVPATLQYREPLRVGEGARRNPFGSAWPFEDDPFSGMPDPSAMFDDFFAAADPGREVSRHVTLHDGAGNVDVAALPAAGRPAGTVAIGHFDVAASVGAGQITAGEPVTVRVDVTGNGTFDRVAIDGLQTTSDFRAYAPTDHFAASDALGLAGTKTFEQAVIPTAAGDLVLPPIQFTYFDPDAATYVTRSTDPLHLTVAPSPAGAASTRAIEEPAVPGLRADRANPGPAVSTLLPVSHSPLWLAFPAALLAIALTIPRWLFREPSARRQQRRAHRAAERRVRAALRSAERARRVGDPVGFFAAARTALQERIAERLGIRPQAVTRAELDAHPELGSAAVAIFDQADRLAFSGGDSSTVNVADLANWKGRVTRALEETAA